MKPTFFLCCLLTASLTMATAAPYTVASVPNPKLSGGGYVSNPDGILSAAAVDGLNRRLAALERQTEVQAAVVAVSSIGYADYTEFAYQLASQWGIGSKEKSTGLLLLLVMDQRAVRIETGNGLEGLLPDAVCERLLQNVIFPAFQRGDYDGGFTAGVDTISRRLTQPAALEELLLHRELAPQRRWVNLLTGYFMLALLLWVALAWWGVRAFGQRAQAANNVRYRNLAPYIHVCLAAAICFPLPLYLWYRHAKRQREAVRNTPIRCPECHTAMRRLTEQDEDAYLTPRQQTEEQVQSVDYDVWHCPSCLNHIILPYEQEQARYTTCPHCHTKAYALLADVIRIQATELHSGSGEKTYSCKHCGRTDIRTYIIPQLPMVVVSGGRNRGFGNFGGLGGGSWGGGGFSGGGAGGHF